MRKPLTQGFSREIFIVSFGENGERIERDFDLLAEDEKKRIGRELNRKAMRAAGFVPVERSERANA